MSRALFVKRSPLSQFMLLLTAISLACNTLTGGGGAPAGGDAPENTFPMEIKVEQDFSFGSGSFVLPDPNIGMSELSSYTATLTAAFDGTREGKAEKWSKTFVMLTTREPAARLLTIETSGDLPNLEPVLMAELNGLGYEKRDEAACETSAIQEGDSLADRFEPASFLGGLIGAEEAGNETVNEIPAMRYTFDQLALGEEGVAESSGELWVADEGGYLVRYLLTKKAGEDYFGEGIEGTINLDYQLTNVNQPLEILLPEDCPPGLVNAPTLPDAASVESVPGNLSYDTMSSLADVAAFYQDQLPNLGWTLVDQPSITDDLAVLTFQQADRMMLVIVKPGSTGARVQIAVSKAEESPFE